MITIMTNITDDQISHLLCLAFEGGSNYWYDELDFGTLAEGYQEADFYEGGKHQNPATYWHWSQLVPLHPGCSITLVDREGQTTHRIDRAKLEKGLRVMAEKYPYHWANFLKEDDDADTGDCFLQCVVFGEEIYG